MLSEVMKEAGYQTVAVGKWGLGTPYRKNTESTRLRLFLWLRCQRQAHNLYPVHLWENDKKVGLANDTIPPSTKLAQGADPNLRTSYNNYYQPDYGPKKMQEKALEFIKGRNKEDPFMLYYASPIPHVPLQVPEEYLMKYRQIIGDEEPYLGQNGYFPHQYPKAAYAAMINYLDDQVGELVATLKEERIYENTVIFYLRQWPNLCRWS